MSAYTDSVLAKYPDAGAAVRKALAAALAAAEKVQPGTPVGVSSLKPTGAVASEGSDYAAADAALAAVEMPADVLLAEMAELMVQNEGVNLDEALPLAAKRFPQVAKRYADRDVFGAPDAAPSTDRPDIELDEAAKKIAEERSIPYGKAMTVALAEDPALAERYRGA